MSKSVRALFFKSIDYAGSFPPAQLPLEVALRNYVRYAREPDAWLMGRFVCPATRLRELDSLARVLWDAEPPESRHRVALVVAASEGSRQLVDDVRHDVSNIVEFHSSHGDYARVDSLELKLPSSLNTSITAPIVESLKCIRHQIAMGELSPIYVMIEIWPNWQQEGVRTLLEALDVICDDQLCLKIRAGGLPRDDMPSPEQFAFFIDACRKSKTRWKATAGLHHPLSCFDSEDRVWHFGFLNVFAAAVLASTKQISQDRIEKVLTETSMDAFAFDDQAFSCGDLTLAIPDIEKGRLRSIVSFGSCSFDEPLHGLRDLELITSEKQDGLRIRPRAKGVQP